MPAGSGGQVCIHLPAPHRESETQREREGGEGEGGREGEREGERTRIQTCTHTHTSEPDNAWKMAKSLGGGVPKPHVRGISAGARTEGLGVADAVSARIPAMQKQRQRL
eukprot:3270698-Rhodomonas_salina.1